MSLVVVFATITRARRGTSLAPSSEHTPPPAGRTRTARLVVGLAVATGLLLRLAFGLGYWIDKPLTHDEREYLALARSLRAGEGLRYPTDGSPSQTRFSRAPGYPSFLALVGGEALTGPTPTSSPVPVKVTQSLVGAVGIVLIASLAWRISGPVAGALAALVAAVYPPLVWICAYVLSETVYSALALATVLVLDRVMGKPGERPRARTVLVALAAGLLTGATTLTRPVGLVFLALAVVWLATRSHRPARHRADGWRTRHDRSLDGPQRPRARASHPRVGAGRRESLDRESPPRAGRR